MLDVEHSVESLATFKMQTAEFLERLRNTGEPLVLTIDGKAELVIQDADAYRRLAELALQAEQRETVGALMAGLASVDAGRTKPARETMIALAKEFGFDTVN